MQSVDITSELMKIDSELKRFEVDGKIHRYGKDNHAWYIASVMGGNKGDFITVCTAGSWKDGSKQTFVQSNKGFSVSQATIKPLLVEIEAVRTEEKIRKQKEAKAEAEKMFKILPHLLHTPYLSKKGIQEFRDPEVVFHAEDKVIFVPCRDIDGNLWGCQKIDPEGGKLFQPGQRKKGTFHRLPSDSQDLIYFCEGYATGVTIHLATQAEVIICFDAGNLEPVLIEFRKLYPDSTLVICGDDDRFKIKNIGREKAEKAAKAAGAYVKFPIFSNLENEPTDFNDLHQAEGLNEVRNQLEDYRTQEKVYSLNHAEVEKLPCNTLVLKVLKEHQIINDLAGNTYEFNGVHWEELTESALKVLAAKYDALEHTSTRRRNEIINLIKISNPVKNIPWRNLELDQVPFLNGVWSVKNETLIPHSRSHYLETTLPWKLNIEAECPVWLQCLQDWFGDDEDGNDKIFALQNFFGYVLLPHAKYKKALMCFGEPDTGKSIISELLKYLVGTHNTCSIAVEAMGDPRKVAPIKGKMINLVSELPHDALIADGGFKQLVSTGDAVQIDEKFKPAELYVPFCKHVVCTNTLPKINDQTKATYNRILLISFNKPIPEELRDTTLIEKLKAEIEGIALWALCGASYLFDSHGHFPELKTSNNLLEEHRKSQNPVFLFMEECTTENPDTSIKNTELFQKFTTWHKGKNISNVVFGRLLSSAGYSTTIKCVYGKTTRFLEGFQLC
jgi:P4 family phage/plasmid primase-like protien